MAHIYISIAKRPDTNECYAGFLKNAIYKPRARSRGVSTVSALCNEKWENIKSQAKHAASTSIYSDAKKPTHLENLFVLSGTLINVI